MREYRSFFADGCQVRLEIVLLIGLLIFGDVSDTRRLLSWFRVDLLACFQAHAGTAL
jgi:hypothetical protein